MNRETAEAADRLAVGRTLGGDPRAFGSIVERYTPLLYSLACRLLGSAADAEDAVQEIFERLYRSLNRYNPARGFHPWMYTLALNHLRSLRRGRRRRDARQAPPLDPQHLDARPAPDRGLPDPARRAALAEGERLAAEALKALPQRYREVFVLRQLENLSVAEVGRILKLPEGTVKTFLHRARKQLVEQLARQGWTGSLR